MGTLVVVYSPLTLHRFTDFLVFEVDQDSNEVHIQTLERPTEQLSPREDGKRPTVPEAEAALANSDDPLTWSNQCSEALSPFMTEELLHQLEALVREGPEHLSSPVQLLKEETLIEETPLEEPPLSDMSAPKAESITVGGACTSMPVLNVYLNFR